MKLPNLIRNKYANLEVLALLGPPKAYASVLCILDRSAKTTHGFLKLVQC